MDSRVLRKWTTTSHFKWYTNALKFKYSLHNHILQQVENSKYLGVDNQGWIQDFKLGGGAPLKKLRRAEGGTIMFGVFRVKNHDFTQKNHIWIRPWCPPS